MPLCAFAGAGGLWGGLRLARSAKGVALGQWRQYGSYSGGFICETRADTQVCPYLLESVRGELGEPFRAALRQAQGERWKRLYQNNRKTLTGGCSTVPIRVDSFVRQGQTHRCEARADTQVCPYLFGRPFDGLRANGGRDSTKMFERPWRAAAVRFLFGWFHL